MAGGQCLNFMLGFMLFSPTYAFVAISDGNHLAAGQVSSESKQGSAPATPTPSQVKYDAAMSVCSFVAPYGHRDFPIANGIDPLAAAQAYFHARGTDLNIYQDPRLGLPHEPFKETLLKGSRHGELRDNIYYPKEGYLGPDQITFEVDVKGKKFKVIYSVLVNPLPGDQVYKSPELNKLCPDGFQIKELPGPRRSD